MLSMVLLLGMRGCTGNRERVGVRKWWPVRGYGAGVRGVQLQAAEGGAGAPLDSCAHILAATSHACWSLAASVRVAHRR